MPSNHAHELRGTGRTTRLIAHAHELVHRGADVIIVCDNTMDARRCTAMAHASKVPLAHDVTPGTLRVRAVTEFAGFDWQTLRAAGAPKETVFLVDHHAIEDHFETAIRMLHAYDE